MKKLGNRLYDGYNRINVPENIFKIDYIFIDKIVRNMRVFISITFILVILTIGVVLLDCSISNKIDLLLNI